MTKHWVSDHYWHHIDNKDLPGWAKRRKKALYQGKELVGRHFRYRLVSDGFGGGYYQRRLRYHVPIRHRHRRSTFLKFANPLRYIRHMARSGIEAVSALIGLLIWLGFLGALVAVPILLITGHCGIQLTADVEQTEVKLFSAVNDYREAQGLPTLAKVEFLDQLAREHSQYMVDHGLSHSGFDYRADRILSAMDATSVAENCLDHPSSSCDAGGMAKGWYESPGHRANMLNSQFKRTGVGVAAGNRRVYATQIFTD